MAQKSPGSEPGPSTTNSNSNSTAVVTHLPKGVRYTDFRLLLAGGVIPESKKPTILRRNDGHCLFYAGEVNWLFGKPESGKTWIALAAVVEVLTAGGRVAMLDLDHNGGGQVARRLFDLGLDVGILGGGRFRHAEPEDKESLMATFLDLRAWKPDLLIVDSIGVLMPMMGLSSNQPDDFTICVIELEKFALDGACVIALDHVSKYGTNGPTGTAAKDRAPGGVMFESIIEEPFVIGRGGQNKLRIHKDRFSGVRRVSAKMPQLAATFHLNGDDAETPYSIYKPNTSPSKPSAAPPETDLETLRKLVPPPENVRYIKKHLGWGTDRAQAALKLYREVPAVQAEGEGP